MREEERKAVTRVITLLHEQYKISYLQTLTDKELGDLYGLLFS